MTLHMDVALVIRRLRSSPWYAAAVVLILALVLGANAAMFSAVDATLLNPIAAADTGRLVVSWTTDRSKSAPVVELAYTNYRDWQTSSRTLESVAAFGSSPWSLILRDGDENVRIRSAAVSASFFDTLRAHPIRGRGFRADDDSPNAPRLTILSHGLWTTRFGGDPAIVGKTIPFDPPRIVVGVMPQGFDFPHGVDAWVPVGPELAAASARWKIDAFSEVGMLFILGRIRDGVGPQAVATELDALLARARTNGQTFARTAAVTPLVDFLLGPASKGMWALLAAVVILLVIASTNVAGLLLARLSRRDHEFGIRLALGAPRAHLWRLCLIEATVLATAGGLAGLVIASWVTRAVARLAPDTIPALATVSIDVRIAALTFGGVALAALVSSIWPVRTLGRIETNEAVRRGSAATATPRAAAAQSALVSVQIALAVVLLVAAGLVVRTVINVGRVDLGFQSAGVLSLNVSLSGKEQPIGNDAYRPVLDRIRAVPGIADAGAASVMPLSLGPIGSDSWILLEGQPNTPAAIAGNPFVNYQAASPGYFTTMGIALRRGRLFDDRDRSRTQRVALVSERTAKRLWPGQDPIGRRLLMPSQDPDTPEPVWRTVIGVVADVRYRGIDDLRLDVYDAALQSSVTADNLVVRTSGDPLAVAGAVRAVIHGVDPDAVIDRVSTVQSTVDRATAPWRFGVWIFLLFAGIASALAAIGLFGLVALEVAARRREFAVRMAVGAQRRQVFVLALARVVRHAALGVAAGLFIALTNGRFMQGMLFDVPAIDVTTYAAVVALVVVVVSIASYVPARRAAHTDPVVLLKGD